MGHHLVWTTHELLLGINTPKKMPVNIPVVHDQYHHSVLVNWDPFPWWIYLFWWPFPKSIPYISPWKTLGLLKELEKNPQVADFPWAKTKTSSSNPGKSLPRCGEGGWPRAPAGGSFMALWIRPGLCHCAAWPSGDPSPIGKKHQDILGRINE